MRRRLILPDFWSLDLLKAIQGIAFYPCNFLFVLAFSFSSLHFHFCPCIFIKLWYDCIKLQHKSSVQVFWVARIDTIASFCIIWVIQNCDLKWFEFWAYFKNWEDLDHWVFWTFWFVALGAFYQAILDSILLSLVWIEGSQKVLHPTLMTLIYIHT